MLLLSYIVRYVCALRLKLRDGFAGRREGKLSACLVHVQGRCQFALDAGRIDFTNARSPTLPAKLFFFDEPAAALPAHTRLRYVQGRRGNILAGLRRGRSFGAGAGQSRQTGLDRSEEHTS